MLSADLASINALTDDNEFSLYKTPVGTENGEIIIDMYYRNTFNYVYLREINDTIKGYKIYSSDNLNSWTLLYTGTTVGTYGANAVFNTTKARFVKVEITKTANEYGDACITFSDIKVLKTDDVIKDDLKNALYLADVKAEYVDVDNVKGHFSDEERSELLKRKEKGQKVYEDASASQSEVNSASNSLKSYMLELTESISVSSEDFKAVEQRYLDTFVRNNLELK